MSAGLTPPPSGAPANRSPAASAAQSPDAQKFSAEDAEFDRRFLRPYFAAIDVAELPEPTTAQLKNAGWLTVDSLAQAEKIAQAIRLSGHFEANDYAARIGLPRPLDPAMHYVLLGERLGYAPSRSFDPAYYRARYADVIDVPNCLDHYLQRGRQEGRHPVSLAAGLQIDGAKIDPRKPTVLLIGAGADPTIPPAASYEIAVGLREKYNVAALAVGEGARRDKLATVCPAVVGPLDADYDEIERDYLVERLLASFEVCYAIADAVAGKDLLRPLAMRMVPTVALVHEEAARLHANAVAQALEWSTAIVFPAEDAADSIIERFPSAFRRRYCVVSRAREASQLDSYVARIDAIGRQAMRTISRRREDFDTIADDPTFDLDGYLGSSVTDMTREAAIRHFLARFAVLGANARGTAGPYHRRPSAGFHPQIYAVAHHAVLDGITNPLAHSIRAAGPHGPWRHDVIPLPTSAVARPPIPGKKIAVHGHFYYPELARDFLRRLENNGCCCDLLISTDEAAKADMLREIFRSYGRGRTTVRVTENRGRDIGPLLTEFKQDVLGRYDFIGHLHGKKSLHIGAVEGEAWREFLWEHLLGGVYPMMDIVLDYLCNHENVGLVFAEEWNLFDWEQNLDLATRLARRMDIATPLPPFFDFPAGSMFWARPAALKPLFDLELQWADYPPEPVDIDGTILHAIERLLPLIARRAGFSYAATYVPGICR